MKVDTTKLTEKLEGLRGLDYELAETEARKDGNNALEMTFSKDFQIRLASKALNVSLQELKALPIKEYFKITNEVSRFLFSGLDTEETASNQSDQPA